MTTAIFMSPNITTMIMKNKAGVVLGLLVDESNPSFPAASGHGVLSSIHATCNTRSCTIPYLSCASGQAFNLRTWLRRSSVPDQALSRVSI